MRRYYYGRRRNGDVNALIAFVESMGQARLAMLMRKYASDPDVAPMLAQVADHVLGVPEPEPVVEPARMSDAQAWYALADLVPSALGNLSTEYQSALINAFREEAAKAA
jgi:hypothetical protein